MILYENVKGEDSAVKKILLLGTGGTISSGGSDGTQAGFKCQPDHYGGTRNK